MIRPELIGCGPEPVGEGPAVLTLLTHLIEVLAPVADDQSHHTASSGDDRQCDLDAVVNISGLERSGYVQPRRTQKQPERGRDDADCEGGEQQHNSNMQAQRPPHHASRIWT